MPLLHIDFQEGFEGEPVSARVDGREIFSKPAVRTRMQIGLADSCEVTLSDGDVSLEVTARTATLRVPLRLERDTWVGVSVSEDGDIVHRISSEPFGYV